MSKEIKTTKPKTVKVSTIIMVGVALLCFILAFVAGVISTNHYNATVKAQAIQLSKELK